MVEFKGDFGDEIKVLLDDLHLGVDIGKKVITEVHDFEAKLMAIDALFGMYMMEEHDEYEYLTEFMTEISKLITELSHGIENSERGALHFLLLNEAALESEKTWVPHHVKEAKGKVVQLEEVDKRVVTAVQTALYKIKEYASSKPHLVKIDAEGVVQSFGEDLGEFEEELTHILNRLFQFIFVYEHIFRDLLGKIEKLEAKLPS